MSSSREEDVANATVADKVNPTKDSDNTIEHAVDNAVSYLPGQSKARDSVTSGAADPHGPAHGHGTDAGRAGSGTTGDALKPDGQRSLTEQVGVKVDQALSYVTPNSQKSTGQDLKDTVTPGHDSSLTPHSGNTVGQATGEQGVLGSIGQTVADAKNAVVNLVSGDGKKA